MKTNIAVLLITASLAAVTAQEMIIDTDILTPKAPPQYRWMTNNAFTTGERLDYNINFGVVTAGVARLEIPENTTYRGRRCYRIVAKMRTTKMFSALFKVDDRIETWMDTRALFPWRFERTIREGRYRAYDLVFFDPHAGKGYGENDTTAIDLYTQDTISIIYFVRTLDLHEGAVYDISSFSPNKLYHLRLNVPKREKIKVPAGTFECYHVKPGIQPGYDEETKGQMELWLTADARKMPVRVRSEPAFGAITMELKNAGGLMPETLAVDLD